MNRVFALALVGAGLSTAAFAQLSPSVNFTFNNTLTDTVAGTDATVYNTGGVSGGTMVAAQYTDNVMMPDGTMDTVLALDQFDMVGFAHQVAPNGGGSYVNQYSILIDLKIPDQDEWVALFQTNTSNNNDGDYWIRDTDDLFGVSGDYTGTALDRNRWNRIIVTVDNLVPEFNVYVDGILARTQGIGGVDGRWTLDPTMYLLADNAGFMPTNAMIANAAVFDGVMTPAQARSLGMASATPVPEPATMIALGAGLLAAARRRRK